MKGKKNFQLTCLAVLMLVLSFPVTAFGYGGGGGSGGSGGGGGGGLTLTEWELIFIDPGSADEFGISEGTIDLNNLPGSKKLTPQELRELESAIANSNAEFWNKGLTIAQGLGWAGKGAGWGLAFTPVGIGVKVAISGARAAADGYAAAVERNDGTDASQSVFSGIVAIGVEIGAESTGLSPVKGIIVSEITSQAANNSLANKAPTPNIGESIMEQSKVTRTPYGTPMTTPKYK